MFSNQPAEYTLPLLTTTTTTAAARSSSTSNATTTTTTTTTATQQQARTITSVRGDKHAHRFLAGTCLPSPHNTNALYLLRFHEEMNELGLDAALLFPRKNGNADGYHQQQQDDDDDDEVWNCVTCPNDPTLVLTCTGGGTAGSAAKTKLWKIPHEVVTKNDELDEYHYGDDDDGDGDDDARRTAPGDDGVGGGGGGDSLGRTTTVPMTEVLTLPINSRVFNGRIAEAIWRPEIHNDDIIGAATSESGGGGGGGNSTSTGDVVTLTFDGKLTRWDLASSSSSATTITTGGNGGEEALEVTTIDTFHLYDGQNANTGTTNLSVPIVPSPRAAWDPHDSNRVAVTIPPLLTTTSSSSSLRGGGGVRIYDLRTSGLAHQIATTAPDNKRAAAAASSSSSSSSRCFFTDVDYNPNKPNALVTSCYDGTLKFWDVRCASTSASTFKGYSRPVKIIRGGHSHCITNVLYNTFHDQLLITSGSDSAVNLWRIGSVSSSPLLLDLEDDDNDRDNGIMGGNTHFGDGRMNPSHIGEDYEGEEGDDHHHHDEEEKERDGRIHPVSMPSSTAGRERRRTKGRERDGGITTTTTNNNNKNRSETSAPDVRVSTYEHNTNTATGVYGLTWSAVDAWSYVSVGYDGRVVLNHVPSKEKYKILL